MSKKVNVTFDDVLLERIDETAKAMGLNRSAFLAVAANSYFGQQDAITAMNNMPEIMRKLEAMKDDEENRSKA